MAAGRATTTVGHGRAFYAAFTLLICGDGFPERLGDRRDAVSDRPLPAIEFGLSATLTKET
jgi:hypothetical protein